VNSSTSTSEAVAGADRWRAIVFLAVFAMSLGTVMGFNWVIDPYNLFGSMTEMSPDSDGVTNLVLQGMGEVAKIPQSAKLASEVIIVGDSRARNLTPSRLASSGGRSVLNLGVGGASFEEMISFLHDQASGLTSARLLIIGTPMERMSAAPRPDRCLEVKPIVANRLRYLANAEILKNSWDLWRRPPAAPAKASKAERAPADHSQNDKEVKSTWRRMYGDFNQARADARVQALREAIQPFVARGVTVVFWSPPIREEISAVMDKLDLQKERARLSLEMAEFGSVVDMTEWDTVAGQKITFKDPVHANEDSLILQELQAALPH
jgi:hypothetical protein